MSAFEGLAHVGGVMYEGDDEKIAKFFNMIAKILADRKKAFKGGNYSQYVQVHGVVYPAILVTIDNFSAFMEKTKGIYENLIIQLSKEGVGHGIFLLLSAGGFGLNDIPNRIAENIKTVLCLELPDKFAYADVLHTLHIDVIPESGIKGRGLAVIDSRILEYQAALALEADDDYQRMEKISEVCTAMNQAWTGRPAQPVPEIPEKPTWEIFADTEEVHKYVAEDHLLPVGYNSSNAEIYNIDLEKIYCYLITGAANTGKKNFMKIMIEAARLKNSQICVLDGSNMMHLYAGQEDVTYVGNNEELFDYFHNILIPEFVRRNAIKKQILAAGGEEEELYEHTRKETPVFIFIPDMVWFINTLYAQENNPKTLENLTEKGRYHNIYFVGAMNISDKSMIASYKTFINFVSYKTGIHFGGKVTQNNLLNFDYLSFNDRAKTEKAGIGQLPEVNGEAPVQKIVVPLMTKKKKTL